jgi:dTDP-4-dehydrorhamnose 3,5-epimerase
MSSRGRKGATTMRFISGCDAMKTSPLRIPGAMLVECDRFVDARGDFVTYWESVGAYPGASAFAPHSAHHATSERAGTLRGMHYQREPHAQSKLVSCAAGRVWEVVLDLRRESPTYLQWEGLELDASASRALLIPRGCAHGYVTLVDRTTLAYLIEGAYVPQAAGVVRWNDAAIGIGWPVSEPILSDKDRLAPDYRP